MDIGSKVVTKFGTGKIVKKETFPDCATFRWAVHIPEPNKEWGIRDKLFPDKILYFHESELTEIKE